MPNEKGSALPLIIFAVVVIVLIGVVFYFMGVFKGPQSNTQSVEVTPPLTQTTTTESAASALQTPTPSGYENPFASPTDDSYENPFNSL